VQRAEAEHAQQHRAERDIEAAHEHGHACREQGGKERQQPDIVEHAQLRLPLCLGGLVQLWGPAHGASGGVGPA
jgi:hypothetical protein